jgi:hypothetical protein
MNNVPALAPEHHAYVPKEVRDKSLSNMLGKPQDEDPDEMKKKQLEDEEAALAQREAGSIDPAVVDQPSDGQAESAAAQVAMHVRKRKLYTQVLGSAVEWFPLEMDIDLVKELVWEAGSPRWVLLGTPASGAAVHGSFEMGCSVVALCIDEHHRTHLLPAIVVRAVEAMVSQSSRVFKDDVLHARSLVLDLDKKPTPRASRSSSDSGDSSSSKKPISKKAKAHKKGNKR